MNRADRRRRKIGRAWVNAAAPLAACPDCDAEVTTHVDQHGVGHVTVAHDDTCPTYRALS